MLDMGSLCLTHCLELFNKGGISNKKSPCDFVDVVHVEADADVPDNSLVVQLKEVRSLSPILNDIT